MRALSMTFQEKRKSLIARSARIVLLIFAVNYVAMMFYWYSTIWWFDMPMHFLGGYWLGLTGLWLYFFARRTPRTDMSIGRVLLVTLCIVFLVGIGWEMFEFGIDRLITLVSHNALDTASDICFDLAGGLSAALMFIRRGYAGGDYTY